MGEIATSFKQVFDNFEKSNIIIKNSQIKTQLMQQGTTRIIFVFEILENSDDHNNLDGFIKHLQEAKEFKKTTRAIHLGGILLLIEQKTPISTSRKLYKKAAPNKAGKENAPKKAAPKKTAAKK